ncbi:MAG: MAPEG family protein, partial [Alphaproteobacteria bacterium]|nr:MAPEG family protein [Alphaproteobacteria bacterium]
GLAEIKGWGGRARRAHFNMVENLVLFAALVLIVAVTNKANATTAAGAAIFFWARLAYAVIYLIGIPWLRTLAWAVSVIGMAMIASVLL